MMQAQLAFASDASIREAMLRLGWRQPVSGEPVAPWVLPVVIVGGGNVTKLRLVKTVASQSLPLTLNTAIVFETVPDGKQWRILFYWAGVTIGTNIATVIVIPVAFPTLSGASIIYPRLSATALVVAPGAVFAAPSGGGGWLLGPGDRVGIYNSDVTGGTAEGNIGLMVEESDVP